MSFRPQPRAAPIAEHATESSTPTTSETGALVAEVTLDVSGHRVKLVQNAQNALSDHSKLDDKRPLGLAVHMLDAVNHIPEKAR